MIFQLVDSTTASVVVESRYQDLILYAKSVQFFPSAFTIQRKEN